MERTTSFEQLSGVLGLVTHTFCPIALKCINTDNKTNLALLSSFARFNFYFSSDSSFDRSSLISAGRSVLIFSLIFLTG